MQSRRLSDRSIAILLSQTERVHLKYQWVFDEPATTEQEQQIEDWASLAESELLIGYASAPYWDDAESLDDELPEDQQPWYGLMQDTTFVENLAIWGISAFIAYSGQLGAAIQFLTFAPKFVLQWKKSGIGGAIRVFIDGIDNGLIDTYDTAGGIVEASYTPTVSASHTILQVLESIPAGVTLLDMPGSYPMQVIRKRLTDAEVDVLTDLRQEPLSGQLEMLRGGEWIPVPTANNVRVDGTVPMTSGLEIVAADQAPLSSTRILAGNGSVTGALNLVRSGAIAPGVGYGVYAAWFADDAAFVQQTLARITARYLATTVGARRSDLFATVYDTVAREGWRIATNGAAPQIGFLGAAPQPRPAITGERQQNEALTALLSALAGFGLITDSTTAGTLPTGPAGADGADGADGATGPAGPAGPTGGTTPPTDIPEAGSVPSGTCVEFDLQLNGNGQVIIPVVMQSGYTIQISALSGAASDQYLNLDENIPYNLIPNWYCPNGQNYFAGGCIGDSGFIGSDPLPSAKHMVLLASVNGTFFDCSAEPLLEIGTGVYNVLVAFQLNDADLSDNSGTITFHVEICNPDLERITDWRKFDSSTGADLGAADNVEWLGGISYRVTNSQTDTSGGKYWYIGRGDGEAPPTLVYAISDPTFSIGGGTSSWQDESHAGHSGVPDGASQVTRWYVAYLSSAGVATCEFNAIKGT